VIPSGFAARAPRQLPVVAFLLLAAFSLPAISREAPEVGDNPAVERHMLELSAELRCLQCQNQNLADSNAPLAVDLRQQIREMLTRGDSDDKIREYLVARYGDFVLYRPPVKAKTWVLWFGPGVLLVGGVLAMILAVRRRREKLAADGAANEGPEAVGEQGGTS
jgi:cytochrome c-type biogenesis protein CcmH